MYDKVNSLGAMLQDSRPTYMDNGDYIAPLTELSKDAQLGLEDEIKSLTLRTSRYLDQCAMKPRKPLWHYDRKNNETHASKADFIYGHLI